MPEAPLAEQHWEELYARTGDNLAAAREILKDAGTVTRWSQKLRAEVQRGREARQARKEEQPATQEEQPATQKEQPATQKEQPEEQVGGRSVVVVRMEHNLDLIHSPQLRRLLLGLAAGTGLRTTDAGMQIDTEGSQPPESRQAVVVDLRDTTLMDMSGVSCLIAGHRALTTGDLRLVVLLVPGSQPERVFAAINLGRIIPAFESLDDGSRATRQG